MERGDGVQLKGPMTMAYGQRWVHTFSKTLP